MTVDQILTLAVLTAVVGMLIWDRVRADVVALAGSAILLMTNVVRPVEVQGAFASPAIIALASLFVIVYALELSGLLDRAITLSVRICRKLGATGIWLMLTMIGSASCFLNSTPIVVLAAPVVRDVANTLKLSPKRFLLPLSYITVLTGCCTLIGTSTNLIVDDMAAVAGQPRFGIFEITPVGLPMAIVGGIYLYFFSGRLVRKGEEESTEPPASVYNIDETHVGNAQVGNAQLFEVRRPLVPWKAWVSCGAFVGAIVLATMNVAPIAATAFSGAVLLIILRVISADEAYRGLKPEILILIAGMVVIGIAIEQSGLADKASKALINSVHGLSPMVALVTLYVVTMVLTELLSNATVAVLVTPIAVALAESLGVSSRPFIVAVMMGASAAFSTPFGYQTNLIVYQMGGYRYTDFVRMGLPLNVITCATAIFMIMIFFPF